MANPTKIGEDWRGSSRLAESSNGPEGRSLRAQKLFGGSLSPECSVLASSFAHGDESPLICGNADRLLRQIQVRQLPCRRRRGATGAPFERARFAQRRAAGSIIDYCVHYSNLSGSRICWIIKCLCTRTRAVRAYMCHRMTRYRDTSPSEVWKWPVRRHN